MENDLTKPYYDIRDTKNANLLAEREAATFNVEELAQFMFGGPGNYFEINKRREITRLALSHPIHHTHLPLEYLDAEDHYTIILRKSLLAIKEVDRLNITDDKHRLWFFYTFCSGLFVLYVHTSMCLYAIEMMANEEQKQKFLPLARSFHMMTSYAQTELGHGTDLRQLETEAVFDVTTDSFILNTPTLTSTKFWPGSLAKTANCVLLMAQLYAPDRDHPCGLQMFLVQIRDFKTHEPLPGIELGEIGTRFANLAGDNGYLRLHNVHIPRTQMLMRLAEVDERGHFHRRGDARLLYSAMINMRIHLCYTFAISLSHAVTIAVRYSAVRCQGLNPNGNEIQIIDYPLQQEKLLPSLSTGYAFLIAFMKLETYFSSLKSNPTIFLDRLPELHALSSGLKSYTSTIGEQLAHVCRVACGGHGFLVSSGIVSIKNYLDAVCSAEGDNVVLLQQTARYLLKMMQLVLNGTENNLGPSIAYLNMTNWPSTTITNMDDYCRLFEIRSQRLIQNVYQEMSESLLPPYDTFLKNSLQVVQMAKAHIETYVLRAFQELVQKSIHRSSISSILEQLFYVFAIHTLRNASGDFIRLKLLSADQVYELENSTLLDLYSRLRPNVVALVDAFDFHDHELNSCLGRYDGQVYEALIERARLNPSNYTRVHPVWLWNKRDMPSKL